MGNPLIHMLVFVAAVIIPGGLLVYFAWRAARTTISSKREPSQTAHEPGIKEIPDELPSPEEALRAFTEFYPNYSKDSLRARNRVDRILTAKTRSRKNSQ